MPILKDKNFPEFRGLHLWHAPMSSCSQRVRIALCLKELSWVSHPLKLDKGEHAKSDYLAINPKGLVPSLINDGEVITDSIDILSYIEEKFGQPALEDFLINRYIKNKLLKNFKCWEFNLAN